MVWNITKDKLIVRMTVSPDAAWSVAGPKPPLNPPAKGTIPDPTSDFIKAGRWKPADDAQADMIKAFKKEHGMK
jgi:hypothetical protein